MSWVRWGGVRLELTAHLGLHLGCRALLQEGGDVLLVASGDLAQVLGRLPVVAAVALGTVADRYPDGH
jgi:hypothetical protein